VKILVDHGAYENFGDLAMLETAVERLRGIEGAELHVQVSPLSWPWGNVRSVDYHVLAPGWVLKRAASAMDPVQPIRRKLEQAAGSWRNKVFDRVGRGARAGMPLVRAGGRRRALARWCEDYDALFIAGGGDMNDVFPDALWRCCALINAFAAQRKPVFLSGQQLGPMRHGASLRLLQAALRGTTFVGVREPTESLELCVDAGLDATRMAMTGDDSLGLQAAGWDTVESLLARSGVTRGEFIAVNVRIGDYTSVSQRQLGDIAALLGRLAQDSGRRLLAVPISVAEGDSDVVAAEQLRQQPGCEELRILEHTSLSAALLKGVLGSAYAAIGMSYHFGTFALSHGVPAIALHTGDYYGQKAKGLSGFWGDERLALAIEELGADALNRVQAVFGDESLRAHLEVRVRDAVQEWQAAFERNVLRRLRELALRAGSD
jgi:polysaccharide pyruvyl transferase WcaK-like protein